MKSISLLQVLRVAVLVYEWLDIPALKRYYDFGFDHYNLPWHKAGMSGLRDTVLGRSGPFAKGNWVLPDLSIQHAVEVNKRLQTYPNTYYFRYTKNTKELFLFFYNFFAQILLCLCWVSEMMVWFFLPTCLWFYSYATNHTRKVFSQKLPRSFLGTHPLLFLRALQMCLWRHPSHLPPPYEGYRYRELFFQWKLWQLGGEKCSEILS